MPVPVSTGLYYVGEIHQDTKKRFEDGTLIHTAPVLKEYKTETENGVQTYAETLNSIYLLEGMEANSIK